MQPCTKYKEAFSIFCTIFIIIEMELGYYCQRVNVLVASRGARRMKTWDHRKLGNFKKIPEILGITCNSTQNKNFGNFAKKFQKKTTHFLIF